MTDFAQDFIHVSSSYKLPPLPSAYRSELSEDDYEEYDNYEDDDAYTWPRQYVARPSIKFLVANYAPPLTKPKPLEEMWISSAAANKASCKRAAEAVAAAEKAYDKVTAELLKAETESKAVNKWSAARTTSAALIKRLQDDAAAAAEAKKKAVAGDDKIFKEGEPARWMLANQKKREEVWEEFKQLQHEDWRA